MTDTTAPRSEDPAGDPSMKRRILDCLRTTIGLALVILAVLACAVVQIEADDREDAR